MNIFSDTIAINRDDEIDLSPRQRGHRYGYGDHIFGVFESDDGTARMSRVVRYDVSHGGSGYYDESGDPLHHEWELTEWRYATAEEIEAFEAAGEVSS